MRRLFLLHVLRKSEKKYFLSVKPDHFTGSNGNRTVSKLDDGFKELVFEGLISLTGPTLDSCTAGLWEFPVPNHI